LASKGRDISQAKTETALPEVSGGPFCEKFREISLFDGYKNKKRSKVAYLDGTRDENRTRTTLRSRDFKSQVPTFDVSQVATIYNSSRLATTHYS
jgi:hypothetical protein